MTNRSSHRFHSNLRLFAMVGQPLDVGPATPASERQALLCVKVNGHVLVAAYLSPLDAMLGGRSLSNGEFYFPVDFRRVDFRHTCKESGGYLNVAVCYAFAANAGRLLVNESVDPVTRFLPERFPLGEVVEHDFSLGFSARTLACLDDVYRRAGMRDVEHRIDRIERWSREQLENAEQAALGAIDSGSGGTPARDTPPTQCAVFDAEGLEWIFVDDGASAR